MNVEAPAPQLDAPSNDTVADLETNIRCRLGRQVPGFHLVVAGGGLILRGRAPSYHAKQLVQHAVMKSTRLPILANEIEVF
jgi:hypothetical protein